MIQKIAVSCLAVLLCVLGYFAYNYADNENPNKGSIGPHLTYRVQGQPPPITVEAVRQEEAIVAAGKVAPPLYLNGHEIVASEVSLDRTPEEWRKIDAATMRNAFERRFGMRKVE